MRAFVLYLLFAAALVADPALAQVRQARALLGAETWSQVLCIDHRGRNPVYPKKTYALVFEFNRILWLYTPYDGTQSISLQRGRTEEEKRDLGRLLTEVSRDFRSFDVLPTATSDAAPIESMDPCPQLPNGCFINSLAALRRQLGREWIRQAALLCYYYGPGGRNGHTVLTYMNQDGLWVWDPDRPHTPLLLDRTLAADARRIAESVHPTVEVKRARLLPIERAAIAQLAPPNRSGEVTT